MFIKQYILDNVFFICQERQIDGREERVPVATGFQIAHGTDGFGVYYFVTARHVVEKLITSQQPAYVRINRKAGECVDIPIDPPEWFRSEESDIAVVPIVSKPEFHNSLSEANIAGLKTDSFIDTDFRFRFAHERGKPETGCPVWVGDRLVSPGLFVRDYGTDGVNLPVVRFGHIARMPSEVNTPFCDGDTFRSAAYLAEFLSWGGMSGSPVYWYREFTTAVSSVGNQHNQTTLRLEGESALLGVLVGHSNIKAKSEGRYHEAQSDTVGEISIELNSGIAVVVPAHTIIDLLNTDELREQREDVFRRFAKQQREQTTTLDGP